MADTARDLGRKHVCFKCSAKFYDLKKPRALCPKCGADQADAPAIAAPPPPPPPVKRGPRPVDPVEEPEPPPEEEEAAAAGTDEELDLDAGTEEEIPPVEEEPETGEDSYD